MPPLRPAFLALLAALPAAAQDAAPMGAAEFEAYVTGKTLYYALDGIPYGVEEYRQNRRVRWSFLGDECKTGEWYPSGRMICFEYDDDPTGPKCWTFFREGSGLRAVPEGDESGFALYETFAAQEPMTCTGPEVGV